VEIHTKPNSEAGNSPLPQRHRRIRLWLAMVLVLAACSGNDSDPGADESDTLTLITHQSFAVSDGILEVFEAEHGVTVEILRSDDAGTMVNQVILTRDNPLGDVLFGIDNTFLSRALDEGILQPYESSLLASVPADLQLDPDHRATPIDFGDVCLNFDRSAFAEVDVPQTLLDLVDESLRGQLVVENPATSSPGLAFLLATIAEFGEDGDYTWRDYWADLRDNDVTVTAGWSEAYEVRFSGGYGAGDLPLVVSYASSPPAEVYYSEGQVSEAPTGVIEAGCFRQIEFAGILTNAANPLLAGEFIDFMLGLEFQEDIPLSMFVFPANRDAALPEVFVEHTVVPSTPATLDPEAIDANRQRWIEEWDAVMLP
jgi:thiamine transport system substrate-binding protein